MGLFAQLPADFPKLGALSAGLAIVATDARPDDLGSLARQLREAYRQARRSNYDSLNPGQWRQLPYAYWGEMPPLPEVEPTLVRRYWREVLSAALMSRPTVANRWLTPLLHTYVWSFQATNGLFVEFANQLYRHLVRAEGPLAQTWRDTHRRHDFFRPEGLGKRLADSLLSHPNTVDHWLATVALNEDFPSSPLGHQVLAGLLQSSPASRRQALCIDKVLNWAPRSGAPPHRSDIRVPFANALLLPWEDPRTPTPVATRELLLDVFVRPQSYGDPRWPGRAGYQWHGVEGSAISVVKRWLAGKSLEIFIDALKLTADETWRYREKFWLAYYRRGYIDDVWLVLGSQAQQMIGTQNFGQPLDRGLLVNDSPGQRSVLLLQIGKLTFVEWSHNGALRAYLTADPRSPRLYRNEYDAADLSDHRSLWMHDEQAQNKNPHLYHHGGSDGVWQSKARDFIRREVGIHLPISEIV